MALESWITFVIIWTIAGLPLGPNAVHTINITIRYGYPRCFYAPIGMALACIIHASIASLGLGALLLLYPDLFLFLKVLGVIYLVWMGMKLWCSAPKKIEFEAAEPASGVRLVASACVVSLVNPKAVLSYVAVFLPFIDSSQSLLPQLAILIPTATIIVFMNYVGYALLAWPIRRWMTSDAKRKLLDRVAVSMFIGFAGLLAMGNKEASS